MPKMPVLFVGHGSPMNAILDNHYTQNWKNIASKLPRPEAILSVSAHWFARGTKIINYNALGSVAKLAVPTPDHFYPLLYVLGASDNDDKISVYNKACELGSLTMTAYLWE